MSCYRRCYSMYFVVVLLCTHLDVLIADDTFYSDRFFFGGFDGGVQTSVIYQGELYTGGSFTAFNGDTDYKYLARWDGADWHAVPIDLPASVFKMIVHNDTLYIATTRIVYAYDGDQLQQIGGQFNTNVLSIIVYDGDLIAAGSFSSNLGSPGALNRIARWDGTNWQPLGDGFNFPVRNLLEYNGDLIAGGQFTESNGLPLNRIARWDGNEWSPLGAGFNSNVFALIEYDGELIAGGQFAESNGVSLNRMAQWDGEAWINFTAGFNNTVWTLELIDTTLYAGGVFIESDTTPLRKIARLVNGEWQSIDNEVGVFDDTPTAVMTITSFNDQLFIGGGFFSPNSPLRYAAILLESGWEYPGQFTTGGLGFNNRIEALTSYNGNLIAGGSFTLAGDVPADRIALKQDNEWQTIGDNYPGVLVYDFETFEDDLIVGGVNPFNIFNTHVLRWDGITWSQVGSPFNNFVYAVYAYDGNLYAGGSFTEIGTNEINRVSMWNGTSWQPLAEGLNGMVFSLVEYDGHLIAGGAFAESNGLPLSGIARWTGTEWQPLGDGLNGQVRALTIFEGDLIAGGFFTESNGTVLNRIARWNGTTWEPIGDGFNSGVYTLSVFDGELITGGIFSQAGGTQANGLARWSGEEWQPLGGGASGSVYALSDHEHALYIGGDFTEAGSMASARAARWYDPPRIPALISPENDISDVNLSVNFEWESIERAAHYRLQISEDADFTQVVVDIDTLTIASIFVENLPAATELYWRVSSLNDAGTYGWSEVRSFTSTLTNVKMTDAELPEEFALLQNYPNPFNPSTTIRYAIPEQSRVRLEIYNMVGQRVDVLVDDILDASLYETTWHSNHASGMYFYRLEAVPVQDGGNPFVRINSMLLVR